MDCGPPGCSVHGILQARILAWLAIPFPRGSSWLRDLTGCRTLQAGSLPSEPPGRFNTLKFYENMQDPSWPTSSLIIKSVLPCVSALPHFMYQPCRTCRVPQRCHTHSAFHICPCVIPPFPSTHITSPGKPSLTSCIRVGCPQVSFHSICELTFFSE